MLHGILYVGVGRLKALLSCLPSVCVFGAGVSVARMLIDQGNLVLIADNQGIRDIYSADGNSIDKSTPLVVLVNKGTASASEVRRRTCYSVLTWPVTEKTKHDTSYVLPGQSSSIGVTLCQPWIAGCL